MTLLVFTHLKKTVVLSESPTASGTLKEILGCTGEFENDDYYYTQNGKRIGSDDYVHGGVVYAVPRLVGGKGGFGSMLRAIGAQIEKTTNREACRDLSGRRLRDINEEKRLKNWIAQQADREREVAEKRKKKLERLCAEPKHEFQDKEYDKERSDLTEKVWDAVDQGIRASTSGCSAHSSSNKRKLPEPKKPTKKTCLWVADVDDLSSCDSDDSEEDGDPAVSNVRDVKSKTEDKGVKEESIENISETSDDSAEDACVKKLSEATNETESDDMEIVRKESESDGKREMVDLPKVSAV